jgi:dethiobiotin synthetase
MAAAREGRTLDLRDVIKYSRDAIAANHDTLLIEGVGGVMSPITADHLGIDWIAALRLPVILVAGSYLGTISHTLSALDVIARRDLAVATLVISQTAGSPIRFDEIRDTIARFAPQLDAVTLPRLTPPVPDHPVFDRLAAGL